MNSIGKTFRPSIEGVIDEKILLTVEFSTSTLSLGQWLALTIGRIFSRSAEAPPPILSHTMI